MEKISKRLGIIFSEMIFSNGFVHCDPHPGNLLINPLKNKKDFEIVLLDHGLYTSLPREFCFNYGKLWMALLGNFRFPITSFKIYE